MREGERERDNEGERKREREREREMILLVTLYILSGETNEHSQMPRLLFSPIL